MFVKYFWAAPPEILHLAPTGVPLVQAIPTKQPPQASVRARAADSARTHNTLLCKVESLLFAMPSPSIRDIQRYSCKLFAIDGIYPAFAVATNGVWQWL